MIKLANVSKHFHQQRAQSSVNIHHANHHAPRVSVSDTNVSYQDDVSKKQCTFGWLEVTEF